MKKRIALVLCLLMVVSQAACGGQATANESNVSTEQTETKESTTEESTLPEHSSTPAETETVAAEVSFDTKWASNEFEKLIPQPPFDGWTGEADAENVYKMETSQANADGSGTYYDTWGTYIQTLTDCGFSVKGDVYSAEATDSNGNKVELRCGDGYAWITIYTATTEQTNKEESEDTLLKFNNAVLPDLEWTYEEKEEPNGNKYLSYKAKNVPQDVAEDFVEQLKAAGYTLYEESVDEDDNWYFWGFSNDETGGSAIIGFSSKYGKCQIDIFGEF